MVPPDFPPPLQTSFSLLLVTAWLSQHLRPLVELHKKYNFSSGQYYIWQNQEFLGNPSEQKLLRRYQSFLSQNLKDQSIQHLSSKLNSESKLHFFKNAKDTLCISNYLMKINNREARTSLSKLRLGVLPLEIEKGRRCQLSRTERFCKLCNSRQVEDETHFLFECPALAIDRTPFLEKLASSIPSFWQLNNTQKVENLFFNEQTSFKHLEIASNMLVYLINSRNTLFDALTWKSSYRHFTCFYVLTVFLDTGKTSRNLAIHQSSNCTLHRIYLCINIILMTYVGIIVYCLMFFLSYLLTFFVY